MALLSVRDLRVRFPRHDGVARAVDGVSLELEPGEIVGIVGESGSGKSSLALALLRLLPRHASVEATALAFEGGDLLRLEESRLRTLRGSRMAMVFQEPGTALNPVYSVGAQVAEVVRVHERVSRPAAWARAVEALREVGLSEPERSAHRYPHELSGGMQQRVIIAMALVLRPALLIADEPTSGLDPTVQAQILDLLQELQQRLGMAMLLISHDLGVVAEMTQRVLVMYGGQLIEELATADLFTRAHHPYTEALVRAAPSLAGTTYARLTALPGAPPTAGCWPSGCRFHPRCPCAWGRCSSDAPPLYSLGPGHRSRCHLVDEPRHRRPDPASALASNQVASAASSIASPVVTERAHAPPSDPASTS
jgi:oligopeptide/dipeptide ABC transporter ATP-binding protein